MAHKLYKYEEPSTDRQVKDMTKMFFLMVDCAEKYGFDSDKLIGTCMDAGRTVFGHVTKPVPDHYEGCRKIAEYILSRNIPVNTIETTFITPQFYFADLAEQMMLKDRDYRTEIVFILALRLPINPFPKVSIQKSSIDPEKVRWRIFPTVSNPRMRKNY